MSLKFGGHGQRLEVAGTVQQLVLQRKVAQQRLVERLRLFGQSLDRRGSAAQERADNVGHAAEFPNRLLYGLGSLTRIPRVLSQLTLHRLGTRLRDAGLGNLDLGISQLVKRPQLCQHRSLVR